MASVRTAWQITIVRGEREREKDRESDTEREKESEWAWWDTTAVKLWVQIFKTFFHLVICILFVQEYAY